MSMTRADIIFLSPPWGGPEYVTANSFILSESQIGSITATELINRALAVSHGVVCFLPRNTDYTDLSKCKTQSYKVGYYCSGEIT